MLLNIKSIVNHCNDHSASTRHACALHLPPPLAPVPMLLLKGDKALVEVLRLSLGQVVQRILEDGTSTLRLLHHLLKFSKFDEEVLLKGTQQQAAKVSLLCHDHAGGYGYSLSAQLLNLHHGSVIFPFGPILEGILLCTPFPQPPPPFLLLAFFLLLFLHLLLDIS